MITVNNVSLNFGGQKLFVDVDIKFTPGNCYGLIGANGSGKSTFLKLLSGDLDIQSGSIDIEPGRRLSTLKQDHFLYDEYTVLTTVLMGNEVLYQTMLEKDAIYLKEDFSEEDGMRASVLEEKFAEMNGWEAESEAASMLAGLHIDRSYLEKSMNELTSGEKVKVLLAQALFGNPDILLLDEPTNHLDIKSIMWLEDFLLEFKNTVIVVSHDRHFLNKVCTHIADIDFGKITAYPGNYNFWRRASELALQLRSNQNKKNEEKAKDLKSFIQRFSANASKSKQATSRQKQLEKLEIVDLPVSSRKYPYVHFTPAREAGKDILTVTGLSKSIDGIPILENINFTIHKGEKVVFVSQSDLAKTLLFQILMGETEPDSGSYTWGVTTTQSYFKKDNSEFFEKEGVILLDWLREYSDDKLDSFVRGFLGKMLFSGEEALKKTTVLSGGEKVRCMLAKMMLSGSNVLVLDGPTNHLDLESITAVNDGLTRYTGTILFTSHDHQFIQTVADRIIKIDTTVTYDEHISFDEYLELPVSD